MSLLDAKERNIVFLLKNNKKRIGEDKVTSSRSKLVSVGNWTQMNASVFTCEHFLVVANFKRQEMNL